MQFTEKEIKVALQHKKIFNFTHHRIDANERYENYFKV